MTEEQPEQPEQVVIRVRAYPMDPDLSLWAIECSDCGTVGTVTTPESDETCLQHLELHKVDTSQYRIERDQP